MTDQNISSAAKHPSMVRATVRVIIDFALGVGLFALVFSELSLGHGQAFAGAPGWATLIVPAQTNSFMGLTSLPWGVSGREAAIGLLAITFGAITAFNLSLARHLRSVAATVPSNEKVGH